MAPKSSMMLSFLVIVLVFASCSEGGYDMVRGQLNPLDCSSNGGCNIPNTCGLCPSCTCIHNTCVCTRFPASFTETNV
ncbi:hypothetical protein M5689_017621 [Euphorbia peplus]|nr:hypothetical protein M5689_017621 [Euphorbia peplus]